MGWMEKKGMMSLGNSKAWFYAIFKSNGAEKSTLIPLLGHFQLVAEKIYILGEDGDNYSPEKSQVPYLVSFKILKWEQRLAWQWQKISW